MIMFAKERQGLWFNRIEGRENMPLTKSGGRRQLQPYSSPLKAIQNSKRLDTSLRVRLTDCQEKALINE